MCGRNDPGLMVPGVRMRGVVGVGRGSCTGPSDVRPGDPLDRAGMGEDESVHRDASGWVHRYRSRARVGGMASQCTLTGQDVAGLVQCPPPRDRCEKKLNDPGVIRGRRQECSVTIPNGVGPRDPVMPPGDLPAPSWLCVAQPRSFEDTLGRSVTDRRV